MSYSVIAIPEFSRELKILAKKYRSLKTEFAVLIAELSKTPNLGTPLGNDVYKNQTFHFFKGKSKSGGTGVITNFVIAEETVFLITIYDKSEKENLKEFLGL